MSNHPDQPRGKAIAYHTALKSHSGQDAHDGVPACDIVEHQGCVALSHDLIEGSRLPEAFDSCDVFYADLPWKAGFATFEDRAGVSGRNYADLMWAVGRALWCVGVRPCVLVCGKTELKRLPVPGRVVPTVLNGFLPVVVINKSINERMAATVRHNRARGEHSIGGMGKLVFEMLENGWDDATICNHLGLEPEELLKLKHITGFSALYKDVGYNRAWETKKMIQMRLEHQKLGQEAKSQ